MVPILRAASSPRYDEVIAVVPSQQGKTEGALSVAGYFSDDFPAPLLWVGPTKSNVDKLVVRRIRAMIAQCPSLKEKFLGGKESNKYEYMFATGASIRLAWGGSPTEMAANNAQKVFVDEVDRIGDDVGGEGSVLELAAARIVTYEGKGGAVIAFSTPTAGKIERRIHALTGHSYWGYVDLQEGEDFSPIWRYWQDRTRHEWAWPCPHCHEYYIPSSTSLHVDPDASVKQAARDVAVKCPSCASLADETHKKWMNDRGTYVAPGQRVMPYELGDAGAVLMDAMGEDIKDAKRGDDNQFMIPYGDVPIESSEAEGDTALSFWVSGVCSPFGTWKKMARTIVRVRKSADLKTLLTLYNTRFGECFSLEGERPHADALKDSKLDYRMGQVPLEASVMIVTVDVQSYGFWVLWRAWGPDNESWLVDYQLIETVTNDPKGYVDLDRVLMQPREGLAPSLVLIDVRYRPFHAFNYIRTRAGLVYPARGVARADDAYSIKKEEQGLEDKARALFKVIRCNSDYGKSTVYDEINRNKKIGDVKRLKLEDKKKEAEQLESLGRPLWHVPSNYPDLYGQQATAEEKVTEPGRKTAWVKRRENHALDCEMMQIIGSQVLKVYSLMPMAVVQTRKKGKAKRAKLMGGGVTAMQ